MHKSLVSAQPHLVTKPLPARSAKVLLVGVSPERPDSPCGLSPSSATPREHVPSRTTIFTRRLASLFVAALLLTLTLLAPTRLTAQQTSPPPSQPDQPPLTPTQAFDLSDEVVRDVLSNFQIAIETRNFDLLMGLFDRDSTKDFPQVREEFAAFFRLHDNIRFRYQLLQATSDKDVAFATADIDMDAEPRDDLSTEQRRSTQMRFQMKQTPKGWRLTGIKPMDFFSK